MLYHPNSAYESDILCHKPGAIIKVSETESCSASEWPLFGEGPVHVLTGTRKRVACSGARRLALAKCPGLIVFARLSSLVREASGTCLAAHASKKWGCGSCHVTEIPTWSFYAGLGCPTFAIPVLMSHIPVLQGDSEHLHPKANSNLSS